MNDRQKKQLDRATKAMLNLGAPPKENNPHFTQKDLERRFRMRVDRKGKGNVEEVVD